MISISPSSSLFLSSCPSNSPCLSLLPLFWINYADFIYFPDWPSRNVLHCLRMKETKSRSDPLFLWAEQKRKNLFFFFPFWCHLFVGGFPNYCLCLCLFLLISQSFHLHHLFLLFFHDHPFFLSLFMAFIGFITFLPRSGRHLLSIFLTDNDLYSLDGS